MVKQAGIPGTVKMFLAILSGRLTRYDQKLQAKQPNIHRLALWFKALHQAEAAVKSQENESSPEALNALKKALSKEFIVDSMPPVKAVLKMIDEFIQSGKAPKYASERLVTRYLASNR